MLTWLDSFDALRVIFLSLFLFASCYNASVKNCKKNDTRKGLSVIEQDNRLGLLLLLT